jgi:hypothetical protein
MIFGLDSKKEVIAGTLLFDTGKMVLFRGDSGHYQNPKSDIAFLLKKLAAMDLVDNNTLIVVFDRETNFFKLERKLEKRNSKKLPDKFIEYGPEDFQSLKDFKIGEMRPTQVTLQDMLTLADSNESARMEEKKRKESNLRIQVAGGGGSISQSAMDKLTRFRKNSHDRSADRKSQAESYRSSETIRQEIALLASKTELSKEEQDQLANLRAELQLSLMAASPHNIMSPESPSPESLFSPTPPLTGKNMDNFSPPLPTIQEDAYPSKAITSPSTPGTPYSSGTQGPIFQPVELKPPATGSLLYPLYQRYTELKRESNSFTSTNPTIVNDKKTEAGFLEIILKTCQKDYKSNPTAAELDETVKATATKQSTIYQKFSEPTKALFDDIAEKAKKPSTPSTEQHYS